MGKLHVIAAEYKCKETDRYLKEQFINGLNDDGRIVKIIC